MWSSMVSCRRRLNALRPHCGILRRLEIFLPYMLVDITYFDAKLALPSVEHLAFRGDMGGEYKRADMTTLT